MSAQSPSPSPSPSMNRGLLGSPGRAEAAELISQIVLPAIGSAADKVISGANSRNRTNATTNTNPNPKSDVVARTSGNTIGSDSAESVPSLVPTVPTGEKRSVSLSQQRPVRNVSSLSSLSSEGSAVAKGDTRLANDSTGGNYGDISCWSQILQKFRNSGHFRTVLGYISVPDTVFMSEEIGLTMWITSVDNRISQRRKFALLEVFDKFLKVNQSSRPWNALESNKALVYSSEFDNYKIVDSANVSLVSALLQRPGSSLQPYIQPYDLHDQMYTCCLTAQLPDLTKGAFSFASVVNAMASASRKFFVRQKRESELTASLTPLYQTHVCSRLSQCLTRIINTLWLDEKAFTIEIWADFVWGVDDSIWLMNISKLLTSQAVLSAHDTKYSQSLLIKETAGTAEDLGLETENSTHEHWSQSMRSSIEGDGAPQMLCFECDAKISVNQRICWNCGHSFSVTGVSSFTSADMPIESMATTITSVQKRLAPSRDYSDGPTDMKRLIGNATQFVATFETEGSASYSITGSITSYNAVTDTYLAAMATGAAKEFFVVNDQLWVDVSTGSKATISIDKNEARPPAKPRDLRQERPAAIQQSNVDLEQFSDMQKRKKQLRDEVEKEMNLDSKWNYELLEYEHRVAAAQRIMAKDRQRNSRPSGYNYATGPSPVLGPQEVDGDMRDASVLEGNEDTFDDFDVNSSTVMQIHSRSRDEDTKMYSPLKPGFESSGDGLYFDNVNLTTDRAQSKLLGSGPTDSHIRSTQSLGSASLDESPSAIRWADEFVCNRKDDRAPQRSTENLVQATESRQQPFCESLVVAVQDAGVLFDDAFNNSAVEILDWQGVLELLSQSDGVHIPPFLHCLFKTYAGANLTSGGMRDALTFFRCCLLDDHSATLIKQVFTVPTVQDEEFSYLASAMLSAEGNGGARCMSNGGDLVDAFTEHEFAITVSGQDDTAWRVGNTFIQQVNVNSAKWDRHNSEIIVTSEYSFNRIGHQQNWAPYFSISAVNLRNGDAVDMTRFQSKYGSDILDAVQTKTRQLVDAVQICARNNSNTSDSKFAPVVLNIVCRFIVTLDHGTEFSGGKPPIMLSSVPYACIVPLPAISSTNMSGSLRLAPGLSDWRQILSILYSFNAISLEYLDCVFANPPTNDGASQLLWYFLDSQSGKLQRKRSKYIGSDICQHARNVMYGSNLHSSSSAESSVELSRSGVPLFALIEARTGDPIEFMTHITALQFMQPDFVSSWATQRVFVQSVSPLCNIDGELCQVTCEYTVDGSSTGSHRFHVRYFPTSRGSPSGPSSEQSSSLKYLRHFSVSQRRQQLQVMKIFVQHLIVLFQIIASEDLTCIRIKFFVDKNTGVVALSNIPYLELRGDGARHTGESRFSVPTASFESPGSLVSNDSRSGSPSPPPHRLQDLAGSVTDASVSSMWSTGDGDGPATLSVSDVTGGEGDNSYYYAHHPVESARGVDSRVTTKLRAGKAEDMSRSGSNKRHKSPNKKAVVGDNSRKADEVVSMVDIICLDEMSLASGNKYKCTTLTFPQLLSCSAPFGEKLALRLPPTLVFDQVLQQVFTIFTDGNMMLKLSVTDMKEDRQEAASNESTCDAVLSMFKKVVHANSQVPLPLKECRRSGELQFSTARGCDELIDSSSLLRREYTYLQIAVGEPGSYLVCEFKCSFPGSVVSPSLRFGERYLDGSIAFFMDTIKVSDKIRSSVKQFCSNLVLRLLDKDHKFVLSLLVDFAVANNDAAWASAIMCYVLPSTDDSNQDGYDDALKRTLLSLEAPMTAKRDAGMKSPKRRDNAPPKVNPGVSRVKSVVQTKWSYELVQSVEKSITLPFKRILELTSARNADADDRMEGRSALVFKINVASVFTPAASTAPPANNQWYLYQCNAYSPCTRKKLTSRHVIEYFRTLTNSTAETCKSFEIVGLLYGSLFSKYSLAASQCKEYILPSKVASKAAPNISLPTAPAATVIGKDSAMLLSPVLVATRNFHRCTYKCHVAGSTDNAAVSFEEFNLTAINVSTAPSSKSRRGVDPSVITSKPSQLPADSRTKVVEFAESLTTYFAKQRGMMVQILYLDVAVLINGTLCVLSVDGVHFEDADFQPNDLPQAAAVSGPRIERPKEAPVVQVTAPGKGPAAANSSAVPSTTSSISKESSNPSVGSKVAPIESLSFIDFLFVVAKIYISINCRIIPTIVINSSGSSLNSNTCLFYTDEGRLLRAVQAPYERISKFIYALHAGTSTEQAVAFCATSSGEHLAKRPLLLKDLVLQDVTDSKMLAAKDTCIQLMVPQIGQDLDATYICVYKCSVAGATGSTDVQFGTRHSTTMLFAPLLGSDGALTVQLKHDMVEIIEYIIVTLQIWLDVSFLKLTVDFLIADNSLWITSIACNTVTRVAAAGTLLDGTIGSLDADPLKSEFETLGYCPRRNTEEFSTRYSFVEVLMLIQRQKLALPYDIRFSSWCSQAAADEPQWYLVYNDSSHTIKKKKISFNYLLEKVFRKASDDVLVGRTITVADDKSATTATCFSMADLKSYVDCTNVSTKAMLKQNAVRVSSFVQPLTIGAEFYYAYCCRQTYDGMMSGADCTGEFTKRTMTGDFVSKDPAIISAAISIDISREIANCCNSISKMLKELENRLANYIEVHLAFDSISKQPVLLNIVASSVPLSAASTESRGALPHEGSRSSSGAAESPGERLSQVAIYLNLVKSKVVSPLRSCSLIFGGHTAGKEDAIAAQEPMFQVFATDPGLVFRKKSDVPCQAVLKKVLKIKDNADSQDLVAYLHVQGGSRRALAYHELLQLFDEYNRFPGSSLLKNENVFIYSRTSAESAETTYVCLAAFRSDMKYDVRFGCQKDEYGAEVITWYDSNHLGPGVTADIKRKLDDFIRQLSVSAFKEQCTEGNALRLDYVIDDESNPVFTLLSCVNSASIPATERWRMSNTFNDYLSAYETYSILAKAKVTLSMRCAVLLFYEAGTQKYCLFASDTSNAIRKKSDASAEYVMKAVFRNSAGDDVSNSSGSASEAPVGFVHIRNGIRRPVTRSECKDILLKPTVAASDGGVSGFMKEGGFIYNRVATVSDETVLFTCECDFTVDMKSATTALPNAALDTSSVRYGMYNSGAFASDARQTTGSLNGLTNTSISWHRSSSLSGSADDKTRASLLLTLQSIVSIFNVPQNGIDIGEGDVAVVRMRVDYVMDDGAPLIVLISIGRARAKNMAGVKKVVNLKVWESQSPPSSSTSTASARISTPPPSALAASLPLSNPTASMPPSIQDTKSSSVQPVLRIDAPETPRTPQMPQIVQTPRQLAAATSATGGAVFYAILDCYLALIKAKTSLATPVAPLLFVDSFGKFQVFATDSNLVLRKKTEASLEYIMRICFRVKDTTQNSDIVGFINTAANDSFESHVNYAARKPVTKGECERLFGDTTVGEVADLTALKAQEGAFVFGRVTNDESQPFVCECEFMNANSMTNIRFGRYNYSGGGSAVEWFVDGSESLDATVSDTNRKSVQYSIKNVISMWDGEHVAASSSIRVDFVIGDEGLPIILLISIAKTSSIPKRFSVLSSKRFSMKAGSPLVASRPSSVMSVASASDSVRSLPSPGPGSPLKGSPSRLSMRQSMLSSPGMMVGGVSYASTLATYHLLCKGKLCLPVKISALLFLDTAVNKFLVFASDSSMTIRKKTEANNEYVNKVCFRIRDDSPATEICGYLNMPNTNSFRKQLTKVDCDRLLSAAGQDQLKQDGVFVYGRVANSEVQPLVCECECAAETSTTPPSNADGSADVPVVVTNRRYGQRNENGSVFWLPSTPDKADKVNAVVGKQVQDVVQTCAKIIAYVWIQGQATTRLRVWLDFIIDEGSPKILLINVDNSAVGPVSDGRAGSNLSVAGLNDGLPVGQAISSASDAQTSRGPPELKQKNIDTSLFGEGSEVVVVPTMQVYMAMVKAKLTLPIRTTSLVFFDKDTQLLLAFSSDPSLTVRKKSKVTPEYACAGFFGIDEHVQPADIVTFLHAGVGKFRQPLSRRQCESMVQNLSNGELRQEDVFLYGRITPRDEPHYVCECTVLPAASGSDRKSLRYGKFSRIPAVSNAGTNVDFTWLTNSQLVAMTIHEINRTHIEDCVQKVIDMWDAGSHAGGTQPIQRVRVDFSLDETGVAVIILVSVCVSGNSSGASISNDANTSSSTAPITSSFEVTGNESVDGAGASRSKMATTISTVVAPPSLNRANHAPVGQAVPSVVAVIGPDGTKKCPPLDAILFTYLNVVKSKSKFPLRINPLIMLDPVANSLVAFACDAELFLRKKANVAPDYAMRVFLGIDDTVDEAETVCYLHINPLSKRGAIRKPLARRDCRALLTEGLNELRDPSNFIYARTEMKTGERIIACSCSFQDGALKNVQYGVISDAEDVEWLVQGTSECDKAVPTTVQLHILKASELLASLTPAANGSIWIEVFVSDGGDASIMFMTTTDTSPITSATQAPGTVAGLALQRVADPVLAQVPAPVPSFGSVPAATLPATTSVPAPVFSKPSINPLATDSIDSVGDEQTSSQSMLSARRQRGKSIGGDGDGSGVTAVDILLSVVKAKNALAARFCTVVFSEVESEENTFLAFSSDKNLFLRKKTGVTADMAAGLFLRITNTTPDTEVVAFLQNAAVEDIAHRKPLTKIECQRLLNNSSKDAPLRQHENMVLYGKMAPSEPLFICRCSLANISAVDFGERKANGTIVWQISNAAVSGAVRQAIKESVATIGAIWINKTASPDLTYLCVDFTVDTEGKALILLISLGNPAQQTAVIPALQQDGSRRPPDTVPATSLAASAPALVPSPSPALAPAPVTVVASVPAPVSAPAVVPAPAVSTPSVPMPEPVVVPQVRTALTMPTATTPTIPAAGEDMHYFDLIGSISKLKHVVGMEIVPTLIGAVGSTKYNMFFASENGLIVKQKNVTPEDVNNRVAQALRGNSGSATRPVAIITKEEKRQFLSQSECAAMLGAATWQEEGAFMQIVADCVVVSNNGAISTVPIIVVICDFPSPGTVSNGVLHFFARTASGQLLPDDGTVIAGNSGSMDKDRMRRVAISLAEKLKASKFRLSRLAFELLQSSSDASKWKIANLHGRAEVVDVAPPSETVEATDAAPVKALAPAVDTAAAVGNAGGSAVDVGVTPKSRVKKGGVITEGGIKPKVEAPTPKEKEKEKDREKEEPGPGKDDADPNASAGAGTRAVSAGSSPRIKGSAGWGSRPQTFVVSFVDLLSSSAGAKVSLECGVLITCSADQRQSSVQLMCTDKSFQIKRQKKADMEVVKSRVTKIGAKKGAAAAVAYVYTKDGRREVLTESACADLLDEKSLLDRLKIEKDSFLEVASMTSIPSVVAEMTISNDGPTPVATASKFRRREADGVALLKTGDGVEALDPESKEVAVAREKLLNLVKIMREQLKFNVVEVIAEITVSDEECILMYASFNVSLASR
jgi:hypothetical protein